MAENLPPADASQNPSPEPKKKKRRGLWWKIPLVLLVLLALLVAFLPQIASTGAVRSFVLGKVNSQIDGRLEVSNWSLSWTGGVSIDGIKLYDARNRLVLEASRLATPVSLAALARGNMDFGRTTLEDLNLTQLDIYPDGTTNYQHIFQKMVQPKPGQPGKPTVPPAKTPGKQPRIDLAIKPFRGTITAVDAAGTAVAPPLEIRPDSELAARVGAASEPISERVNLVLAVAGKPAGNVLVEGTAQATDNANDLKASQKLSIKSLDLGALSPLLALGGVKGQISGQLSGDILAHIASLNQGTAKGELAGSDLSAGGQMLHGDTVKTAQLKIPVDLSLSQGQVVNGSVAIKFDHGDALFDLASLPIPAIQRLIAGSAPGATGSARISVNVQNVPAVLNMLKNTVKLQEGVQVTGGSFTANIGAQLSPDSLRVDAPVSLSGVSATRDGKKIGPLDPITIQAGAKLLPVEGKSQPEVRDLAVDFASGFARFKASGATLAQLQGSGDADVARLREQFGQVFDLSMYRSGQIHFALASASDPSAGPVRADVTVSGKSVALDLPASSTGERMIVENTSFLLTAKPVIDGQLITLSAANPMKMTVDATLDSSDGKSRRTLWSGSPVSITASGTFADMKKLAAQALVTLPFAKVELQELKLTLPQATAAPAGEPAPADMLAMVEKASLNVKELDLAQAYAAAQRFAPPAAPAPATPGAPAAAPPAPLQLAGRADFSAELSRVSQNSEFKLDLVASGVDVRRGATAMKLDKPATVQLAGALSTRLGKDFIAQVAGARVTALTAEIGPAKAILTKPIVLPELAALMQAMQGKTQQLGDLGGAVRVSGDLADMAKFADALAGTKPGAPSVLPLQGQLTSDQEIGYRAGIISLRGDTPIQNLKVMESGKPVFSESEVRLKNDVSLDLANRILKMDDVSLRLVQTDALALTVKGQVNDYGRQQAFKDMVVTVTPDLAKVWSIVRPLLPPEKQAKIGNLVLAGKRPMVINLSGSFPAMTADGKAVPPADAFRSVGASGEFFADLIDYQQYGMKIERLPVPFILKDGQIETAYPDGRLAAAATFNEGKLNLPRARIDLRGEHYLLFTPQNVKLLEGVRLNPVMSSFLGEKVTPFLYDSKEASGLLDVTIVRCDNLPLDASVMTPVASNKGVAEILLSATQLNVNSSGAGMVLGYVGFKPAPGEDRIVGSIKDARITLEGGRVNHDMSIKFGRYDLGLKGDLNLVNNSYKYFDVSIPSEMLRNYGAAKNVLQYLPERVGLSFAGPVTGLRLNEKFMNDLVKGAAEKQLKERLLGGGKAGAAGAAGGAGVGGLLQDLTGGAKDGQKATDQQSGGIGGLLEDLTGAGKSQTQPAPAKKPAKKKR